MQYIINISQLHFMISKYRPALQGDMSRILYIEIKYFVIW